MRRAVAAVFAATGALLAAGADEPSPQPPDVLVLVMDTTRADRCSFLGYERPTTPRLAELARESVVFAQAWSPGAWTFPAHAALFTGRTPDSLGLADGATHVLPPKVPTLAETLSAAGRATGCFTCNPWIAPHSGLSRGFTTWEGLHWPPDRVAAWKAHDAALAFMRKCRKEGKPFFAFVNDVEPHAPWTPPRDLAASFVAPGTDERVEKEARSLQFPRTALAFAGRDPIADDVRRTASDLYDAEIAALDAEIGRLLDAMRADGLLDRTMLVVTSDHGEGLGDHGWMEHGTLLHREILRVPLLVRPPGGCPPRVVRDVVRLHDVFATVLEACGLPVPAGTDALPLLGPTEGRVARAVERTREDLCAVVERSTSAEAAAVFRRRRRSAFDGRFHLVVDDAGAAALWDVANDPGERRDLAGSDAATEARMRALLPPR